MSNDYENENKILKTICLGPRTFSKIVQETKIASRVLKVTVSAMN